MFLQGLHQISLPEPGAHTWSIDTQDTLTTSLGQGALGGRKVAPPRPTRLNRSGTNNGSLYLMQTDAGTCWHSLPDLTFCQVKSGYFIPEVDWCCEPLSLDMSSVMV